MSTWDGMPDPQPFDPNNIPFDSFYPTAQQSAAIRAAQEAVTNKQGAMTDTPDGQMSWSTIANRYASPDRSQYPWLQAKYDEGVRLRQLKPVSGADADGWGLSPMAALGLFAGGVGALGGLAGMGASSLAGADASAGLLPQFGSNLAYNAGLGGAATGSSAMDLTDFFGDPSYYGADSSWSNASTPEWMSDPSYYGADSTWSNTGADPLSKLKDYVTSNPGSTMQTAAKALGLTNSDGSVNWGRILGGVGSAALGMYGANQSTNALERISDKYSAMGAPYRAQLASLYSDPGSFLKSDQVQQPVQQGTNALARALSVNGNPTGSGTALQEMQDYATNSMWGKLGEEKSRLGALGGLSSMPANVGQATDTAAAQSTGQGLNALGYGLNSVMNPQPNTNQLLQQLFKNSLA